MAANRPEKKADQYRESRWKSYAHIWEERDEVHKRWARTGKVGRARRGAPIFPPDGGADLRLMNCLSLTGNHGRARRPSPTWSAPTVGMANPLDG